MLKQKEASESLRKILIGNYLEYSEQKQAQADPLNELNNNFEPFHNQAKLSLNLSLTNTH